MILAHKGRASRVALRQGQAVSSNRKTNWDRYRKQEMGLAKAHRSNDHHYPSPTLVKVE